ncbi:hypothetical protein REPUB_Repub18cG0006700 [Reevesia pubescens]
MPQETNSINPTFTSSSKNLRGLIVSNNINVEASDVFNDNELSQRKAEEAASRRYQAAEWRRQMDQGASESLLKQPSQEEFCLALRNGFILCNVLNKVNPGAVLKVVENPIILSTEGAAQSAIQYFENMRNFLVALKGRQLLTFEGSDVEKLGLFVKKILKSDINSLSKSDFIEAISLYLGQRTSLASNDFSKLCIYGRKREDIRHTVSHSVAHAELIDF